LSALDHVKPVVRGISAYTLPAREAAIKINQNENPHELPDALKRKVMERALARPWGRYPPFDPAELQRALAAFSGWRADGILVGNGSNELIQALLMVTVGAGTPVVIPEPTFTLYAMLTRFLGGRVVSVALGDDLGYDAAAIAEARARSEAPLTVVCSPNNPTGSVLPLDAIASLCRESDRLVVVDEAYHEFAGATVVPLLAEHENLIVLRTFSKAMAMAGLRVGYLLAAPALVREINKARLPYNVNIVSGLAALAAIEEKDALAASVAGLVAERGRVARGLAALDGMRVYPSAANFLLVELSHVTPGEAFDTLHAQGILVRDVSGAPRLSRCLRISIGTAAENDALLAAMAALCRDRLPQEVEP
jgi:histidinol-phosphate aminotransferase